MKFDRLKALIRLANNNPDENEANLAARKVCKVLAENNFSLLEGRQVKTAADKINQARTWNDVKRSTEPDFKSKSYDSNKDFTSEQFHKMYEEFFKGAKWSGFDRSNKESAWSQERNVRYKEAPEPESPFVDWNDKKERKPSAERVCSKCGTKVNTFRIKGDPATWVCNICSWKEF